MKYFYHSHYNVDPDDHIARTAYDINIFIREPFQVYKLADYLMVPELKSLIVGQMSMWFPAMWTIEEGARRNLWEKSMPRVVRSMYGATNSEPRHQDLRKMLVKGLREFLKAGCDWKVLETVMREDADFSVDMFECMEDLRKERESYTLGRKV